MNSPNSSTECSKISENFNGPTSNNNDSPNILYSAMSEIVDTDDDAHLANDSEFANKGRQTCNMLTHGDNNRSCPDACPKESTIYAPKYKCDEMWYDSLDYLPPWSYAYKAWLSLQPKRLDWDRWVMMGMIGFVVGIIGFLLHQFIALISETKADITTELLHEGLGIAWLFAMGYSLAFLIPGAAMVVWYRPSAGGSGIPELIGFLNGTIIRHIFNIRTMVVKFFSCIFAVSSGMPVGPEGPMIHLGGLVGAGMSQFKSDSLGISPNYFKRFRNSEDRRNFISAGAAAGVSSAFGAPVGGLLFSMEEVSSFWNMKLSWQTFFCCMVSTFTTDLFNSAFDAFRYTGDFGLLKTDSNIMFQVHTKLDVNILTFIPSVILGATGGILGALFTFINLKISRTRRNLISSIKGNQLKKVARFIEPCIILVITVTLSTLLPAAFPCTEFHCYEDPPGSSDMTIANTPECGAVALEDQHAPRTEENVELYLCPEGEWYSCDGSYQNYTCENGIVTNNKTYNQAATLWFVTGEEAIQHLFSQGTHNQLSIATCFSFLVPYYFLACWAAGTSISSGLVVPMLLIGALYGRILGQAMVNWFGIFPPEEDPYWAWIDPGAMALIGSASFFAGVSRLTVSLTVIMMEITNDVSFLLPLMTAIMVAKWVGDYFTHPIYPALLEFKCIPFLDAEPVVYDSNKQLANLELYEIQNVMTRNVKKLKAVESVHDMCRILLNTKHGGFPIVKNSNKGKNHEIFVGIISRIDLCMILQHSDIFFSDPSQEQRRLSFEQVHVDRLASPLQTYQTLQSYVDKNEYANEYVNLLPYVNLSCPTVPEHFSLHRTYIIFRTLGLRHLPIVDELNQVVGIVTRKDLMGFKLEERLQEMELQQ